jgi:predicted enzyme related to lactoylglutathione lyase
MIRNPRYVIAVHDLERSAQYYRDVLGFEMRTIADPGWRFFVRDECFIMAGECREATSPEELGDHSYFAYLEVDGIDSFYEGLVARKAAVIKPLRDEPWGMREFGIRTVDGHRIMFGCPLGSRP